MIGEINFLVHRHIPDVVRICADAYEEPWTGDQFILTMRHHSRIGLVYELDGQVVAYAIYELNRGTMNIINMAVDPRFRRKKIGTLLINRMKMKLKEQGRNFLEIDSVETCLAAHLFLKFNGFKAVGVNRGQFGERDGYTFTYARREELPPEDELPAVG